MLAKLGCLLLRVLFLLMPCGYLAFSILCPVFACVRVSSWLSMQIQGEASLRTLNYRGPCGAEVWLKLEHLAGLWESPLLLSPLESNTTSWALPSAILTSKISV